MLPLLEKSSRKSSICNTLAKEFARALDVAIDILDGDNGRILLKNTCCILVYGLIQFP